MPDRAGRIINQYRLRGLREADSGMVHRTAARADVPLGDCGVSRQFFKTKRYVVDFAYRSSAEDHQC